MSAAAPLRGWRAALATGLLAAATCASVFALRNLLAPGAWAVVTCLAVIGLAAVLAGVRAATRALLAPTAVGLVVAAAAVLVRYGAPPGRVQLVPDLGSWERTTALWGEAVTAINDSTVPMTVTRSTELVVVVGALLVLLAADLTVALGHPAWSGLALVTLWLPTVLLGFPAPALAAGVAGLCYLLVLAVSSAPAATRGAARADRSRVALGSSAAVVVLTLALAPIVALVPSWSAWGLPTFGQGAVGPVAIDTSLDMRQSLGNQTGQVVLRYRVSGIGEDEPAADDATPAPSASATAGSRAVTAATLGPLRATTLTEFDGREWRPTPSVETVPVDTDATLLGPGASLGREPRESTGATLARVAVRVEALSDRRLPVPTFPRTLDAPGAWQYDSALDAVTGSAPTRSGMRYTMVTEIPSLTADDLEGAAIGDPGDQGASLALPATEHAQDVAARAREIADGAATPYAQAMNLQTYLRSTTNFTYDTRVAPSRSGDAVWDFLQSRRGYCVQFATTMAVMARTLGIPSRVGVGFLPGDTAEDGSRVVTGKEAHAWPELYFEDFGWVRFEPTPAVQTGAPPAWSDPFANVSAPEDVDDNRAPQGAPTSGATSAPEEDPQGPTPGAQAEESSWWPIGITAAAVLVVAGLAALVLVRRRSRQALELTPEQAWARLRARLAAKGVTWTDATTPRDSVARVRERVEESTGVALDDEAVSALRAIATAVEVERYSPREPRLEPGALAGWVDVVVRTVDEARRTKQPRPEAPTPVG
ncbi:transglutaminaseTgpA domain-containing protein [Cellulomonas massiliensis]|uniref:transglutaminase family protein n=1 Tax=Cellulomonas massiliensis TaxID=1465811 RepID=UPI0011C8F59C|nr:DUF3488 and transglutaminase-like domain-containing protein [Cellulomonas massiliensis]